MPQWSDNLKIELLDVGASNWGNLTNNNFKWAIEESITGYATVTFPSDANYNWAAGYVNSNSSQAQRNLVLNVVGTLSQTRELIVPTIEKQYIVQNNTTGSQSITVKTSAGTGVTIPNGRKMHVYADGTNVIQMSDYDVTRTINTLVLGAPLAVAQGGTGATTSTGTGAVVLATSPTISTSLGLDGNLNITGTARRITGDFSNATIADRVIFQTSTVNGNTNIHAITNGTGSVSSVQANNSSDPANASQIYIAAGASVTQLASDKTGTGTYLPMTFYTGGSERMRIDTSGNVGIGTSSTLAGKLDITSGTARMYFSNQSATAFFTAVNTTNTAYAPMAINGSEMILKTSDAERMTINGSGFVGINQTPNGNATFQVQETGSASRRVAEFYLAVASSTSTPAVRFNKYDNDTTTSNKFVEFTINQLNNGSGQINANGASQAAFGTFSDIRLKENIQDLPPQLSNICALRPVEFDYKDGSGHQIGFIAQEMQQVYPDVVGVDRDEMLTVTGWDKTTSRLVKAIQEQQAIIESLTARIVALEQN